MPKQSDEIFLLWEEQLQSLPARPMKAGLFGKSLEDALQTLLQKHPQVIPGKQIEPGSLDPPRFVLLRREMPVGGWSLDHLYVDQRGVLTLVETKLVQNPESRREVIGQIIEYAANAFESWALGKARQYATEFWAKQGRGLDDVLREEFGDALDPEALWSDVEANLENGHLRLIIAADELQPAVRRMIEYLNAEMRNAEVLGLEIKCYGDDSSSLVLVPRLVGQTQATADRKPLGKAVQWPIEQLRALYKSDEPFSRTLDWAMRKGAFLENRAETASFALRGKGRYRIATVFPDHIYLFLRENCYVGGAAERDKFVEELKAEGFLEQDLDPGQVKDGRNLSQMLVTLSCRAD